MSAPAQSAGKFLHAAKDFRLETRNLPTLSPDDVQVAIRSTTLCGSDLHYYSHFRNGSILVREPLCLGHESSGEITALGSRIHELNPNLQLGDRVALEVGIPCGDCQLCEAGRYNICAGLRFRSSGSKFPHYQGTLQESVVHPARWVYKLPEALSYEVGALLEPLAVAVQAVHRAKQFTTPFAMDEILIIGAGAIGLLTAVAARAAGAVHVVMADIHEGRLAFARGGGFATTTYSVQPRRGDTIVEAMGIARSTAEDIGQLTWPNGKHVSKVQVTFECTGVASSIQTAIYATRSGGTVVAAGLGTPNVTIPISEATAREISIVPTWRYAKSCYLEAIKIAESSVSASPRDGRMLPDISQLITHRFHGLGAIETAFEAACSTSDVDGRLVVKTVVNFPE